MITRRFIYLKSFILAHLIKFEYLLAISCSSHPSSFGSYSEYSRLLRTFLYFEGLQRMSGCLVTVVPAEKPIVWVVPFTYYSEHCSSLFR